MSKPTSIRVLLRHTLALIAKRVFVVFLVLVTFTSVYSITRAGTQHVQAASPATLNFQARLLNSSGSLVPDGTYNIDFKLYDHATNGAQAQGTCSGNCLWEETYTGGSKVTVANGYLSVYLGDANPLPSNIWNQQLYLTMNIGGTSGPTWDGEMAPRIRLTSVPFAFRATVADSAEILQKNTGSFTGTADFATMTADRKFLFPDTSLATTASPGTICVYNGSVSNCPAATGSAYYIHNDTALQTTANFNIQAVNDTGTGTDGTVVGILRGAAGGQTVDLLQFQASGGSVLAAVTSAGNLQVASSIDTYSGTTLNVGTANATAISIGDTGITTTIEGAITVDEAATFNSNVTVAADKTLRLTGGTTATRNAIVSPAEGTLYYDTDTHQLMTFNNSKWKADGSEAVLVAANNSSAADKAAADYIATGTNDQAIIQSAVNDADPAGSTRKTGKVYLFAGTYTTTDTISIPNNTTFAGSGRGTLIQFGNLGGVAKNMLTNSDTTNGTGITIRDIQLDGLKATNTAVGTGIFFDHMGSFSSLRQGATVTNIWANNFGDYGLNIDTSSLGNYTGIYAQGNVLSGIRMNNTRQNNISSNTVVNNGTYGIEMNAAQYSVVTNNNVASNLIAGIAVSSSSNNNSITNNNVFNNGSSTNNNGIYISGSSLNNNIIGNQIDDTAGQCSTNCYSITIQDSGSTGTYLASNSLGIGTINNAATTNTRYGGQVNSSGNYQVQAAGTIELMKDTNITGNLSVGGSTTTQGLTVNTATATDDQILVTVAAGGAARFDGTITNADLTAARTWTLPDADGTLCLTSGNCNGVGGYVLFAPGSAQADNSANPSIFINDTAGGNLLQLQAGAADKFVVDGSGNVTGGTYTFSGVATDITTGTNQDLVVVANGTGVIQLNDSTTILGTANINTTGTATTTIGTSGAAIALDGATTVNNSLSVSGTNTLTVGTGATTLGGTLTVANTANLNGTTNLVTSNATTQTALSVTTDSLTSGTALGVTTSSTALTTGNLVNISESTDFGANKTISNQLLNVSRTTNATVGASAITKGNSTTGYNTNSITGGVPNLTFSHVIPSNSDRVLLIAVTHLYNNLTVTYNGSALTKYGSSHATVDPSNSSNNGFLSFYYLIAPPVGTANIVITSNTNGPQYVGAVASDWYSVNQTTPFTTSQFNASNSDGFTNVTVGATEMAVDALATDSFGSYSANAGQTQIGLFATGPFGIGSSYKAGSISQMGWTFPPFNGEFWGHGVIVLSPASGAGTVTSSGSLVNFSNNCLAICADSSTVLTLNQQVASSTGTVLNILNSGTGLGLAVQGGSQFSGDVTLLGTGSDLVVQGTGTSTFAGAVSVAGNLTAGASAGSGTTFTNNGSTVNSTLALTNFAGGGAIGTAAATVDKYTSISVAQTTASQTLTIPTPTANTVYGRVIYISNIGTASFTLLGSTLNPGATATIMWANTNGGASWVYAGADAGGIQNQNTADQSANFRITGTGRANTAFQAPLFDTATAVALGIGTANATNITLGHNAGTLAVDATNFDLTTAGVVTLQGGQTADVTTQANQNLTLSANGTGTIVLNDTVTTAGTMTFSGVATDITTGTNEDLTVVANGTGTIILNDTVTANGTLTFSGVATDITTATNEDLTVVANGTGTIVLNDTVTANGTLTFNGVTTDITTATNEDLTLTANGTGGINLDDNTRVGASAGSGTTFTNNGSTVVSTLALGDTASGPIGTAAATVDIYTSVSVAQTTTLQTLTIPTPTASTVYGRVLYLSNIGTSTITLLNSTLNPGATATIMWANTNAGAAWVFAGADGTSINNQKAAGQNGDFWIQAGGSSTGIGRADGGLQAPTLDTATAVALAIGTVNATNITLGHNAGTLAIDQTNFDLSTAGVLTLAGGQTNDITTQSNTNLTLQANGSGTIVLNDTTTAAGTMTFSGVATDITTGTNEDLTVVANGTGTIILNDTVTANGTLTFSGVATDITTATNEDLTVVANGTGTIILNDTVTVAGNVTFSELTGTRTLGTQTRTTNVAGTALTVSAGAAGAGASAFGGGLLTLQGGAAGGTGNANGGAVTIVGGAGVGTGTQGLVNLSTTAFTSSAVQTYTVAGVNNITSGLVDLYSTIPVLATTNAGIIVSVPDPAQNTVIGRVLYISARDASLDFTLRLNASGTPIDIAMKKNSTATLIWNGDEWTAAGASSSTDLQSAYNNTLTSAGGAELVLNAPGANADGFTIRNNGTTPIAGGLLEVQSAIGTNLFSVNNFGTELAANGGAETAGGSSTTFPANTWSAAPVSATVDRTITAGQFVTGQAGVAVITSTTAASGVRNNLTGNPVVSTTYQVSFTAKLLSGSFTDLQVAYSRDGGTDIEACTNYSTQTLSTSVWTKITCTITTDSTTATDPDLIIRQTAGGTARTFYIDNLSFVRNDSTTSPSNVQIGGGINGGPITLFTLDRASAPPVASGNTTYYGSMYYDTTSGRIQCYEADGWGACGSPPDNIIVLTPEYTNAVLNGNGVGVLTADFCGNGGGLSVNTSFCAANQARNYYRWTSPQATLQTYSIYVTYKLPSTYKEFASSSTMKLSAFRDDVDDTDALVRMSTYRKTSDSSSLTQCGTTTDITNSEDLWETTSVDGDENGCSFVGGDSIIFKIDMSSRSNTNIYVENLEFTFNNT